MKQVMHFIVLMSVSLLLTAPAASAGDAGQIRTDLDAILAHDQSIDAVTGKAAAETIVQAREKLAALSDEQLAVLTPYAASIERLKDKTTLLATRVVATQEAARAARPARSPGFPDAEYYTDDLCTGARVDTGGLKIAWNTYWAAQTAMLAAKFVCEQDIAGFNGAAVCVPLAIALGVAKQVIENYEFCDDNVDSVETGASYLRLGHLHDDVAVVQETLDEAAVEQIQMDLARRRYNVAEFILPAAFGGKLEEVRTVVVDVLERLAAEGMNIRNAQAHVARSDEAYAAADWKSAFRQLGFAYREAVTLH